MDVKFPDPGTVRHDIATFIAKKRPLLKSPVLQVGSGRAFKHAWWSDQRGLLNWPQDKWVGVDIVNTWGVDIVADFCGDFPEEVPTDFNSALLTEVLEHAHSPQKMLDNTFFALNPGSWIIVTAPFCAHVHNHPDDYWRFTPSGMALLMKRAGFIDIRTGPSETFIEADLCQYDLTIPAKHKIPKGTFGVARKPNV